MENSYISTTTDHRSQAHHSPWSITIDLDAVVKASADEADLNGPLHTLINQTYSLKAAAESISKQINATNLAVLEGDFEKANAAAREALDAHTTANNQEIRYRNLLQKAKDNMNNASAHLTAIKNSKPDAAIFPLTAEIRAWEESVTAAQTMVNKTVDEYVRVSGEVQAYYNDLNRMGEVLNAASAKVADLRRRVDALKGISETAPDAGNGLVRA